MQSNKLRMAIRATAAVAVLGMAGPASAVSFDAGGWDTSVYGYARLNASYDIDEDVSSSTRSFNYNAINVGAAEDNEATGYFGADAFQSRIGIKTTSPEGVTVNIEGDFRGNGGGSVRLRHAYGSYKGILAGQTWSNFTSFVGNTGTLDFDSLPGAAGYQSRTAQLRYTTGPLSISAEQPQNSIQGATKKDGMPALTARIEDSAGGLNYSAAVLAQQLGYDTGTTDDSAFGYATFVAANMALSDMVTIQGSLSYTDGASNYLYRAGAMSGYVDTNGDLDTISGYGGTIGASLNLGGGRSINIGYGMTEVDLDDGVAAGVIAATDADSISAVMANYKWTPVKNVMMGVEYQYGMKEAQNGDDGDASRLLFAAQYNF
ncbi:MULTISPECIES: DcaP family trimeric outer membrane transporter [unclassified Marinobacter]|uniref:DcaP family trimeric outer membrane transporter n=1 Tax=unclassified Marinobacter TaxID=83889 RepID=UPI00200E2DD7|nr:MULTISPECIES: DcaP family trimeric outer membrane transporter [unclassified Marinobacter]MCL1480319.1 porin [Marinobacter sp.]MCL1483810.1 porin [Marinobacter sp.]MCL1487340.1 porin [Marinobacter sp.]UQG55467.1 porin [Marinobacter sp. M4C]UQG64271.1 porin [Marinobacter sp. M2C]